MDSSEYESSALVRFWIFEHAFKFRMKRLTKSLLDQRESLNLKCPDCAKTAKNNRPCLNNIYILNAVFCDLLDLMVSLLQKPITLKLLTDLDPEQFLLCSSILEDMYKQVKFMRFTNFNKLQISLKLVPLILLILREEEISVVMNHLNTLYPHYIKTQLEEDIKKFHISENLATQLKFQERQIRMFILQLLATKEKRERYISTRLVSQVKAYMECGKDILKFVISKTITPYMPKTIIEEMALGKGKDYMDNPDPAIQILLEFLQPEMQEEDLFIILNVLDPKTPIKITFNDQIDVNLKPLPNPPTSEGEEKITSSLEISNESVQHHKSTNTISKNHKKSWPPVVNKSIEEIPVICIDECVPDSSVSSTESSENPGKRKSLTKLNKSPNISSKRKYSSSFPERIQEHIVCDTPITKKRKSFMHPSNPDTSTNEESQISSSSSRLIDTTSETRILRGTVSERSRPGTSETSENLSPTLKSKNSKIISPVPVVPDICRHLHKHLKQCHVKLSFRTEATIDGVVHKLHS